MPISGRIDLHMHSTVSDGTDSPEQLLSRVTEKGISLFSLTDHDAIKGGLEIIDLLKSGMPAFITGVEISCRDSEGKYHILGYGYDPDAESIKSLVARSHSIRIGKLQKRLDQLKEKFGFEFTDDEVEGLKALDNPGKPHIGNLMVKHAYAPDRDTAFKDFLNHISVKSENIGPEEAIKEIKASGGIPVLAHGFFGDGDQLIIGDEMEQRMAKLKGMGLMGAEAFYNGFTPRLTRTMLEYADRYDLFVTAGSDYHGSNKPLIDLGDNGLDDLSEAPQRLINFLSEVADRTFNVV